MKPACGPKSITSARLAAAWRSSVSARRRKISVRMRTRCSVANSSVKASVITRAARGSPARTCVAAHREDARRLVQRVPPIDREFDHRNIERPDQRKHRDDAAGAALVLEGAPQRDDAEIDEKEDEGRGHPPVPFPEGAPGRPAPQRAGEQRQPGEYRPERGGRLGGDVGERDAARPACRSRRRPSRRRPTGSARRWARGCT